MSEQQKVKNVEIDELLDRVAALKAKGYRLVQISCTTLKYYELTYSFGKDTELVNLRMNVPPGFEIQSISSLYWGAFLYENEIHDLFGIKIKNIAVDYKGNLYKTAVKTPFGVIEG